MQPKQKKPHVSSFKIRILNSRHSGSAKIKNSFRLPLPIHTLSVFLFANANCGPSGVTIYVAKYITQNIRHSYSMCGFLSVWSMYISVGFNVKSL